MTNIIANCSITSSAIGAPAVFTTSADHHLVSGVFVTIANHIDSTPNLNGVWSAIVTGARTFTLQHPVTKAAISSTVAGTGGTLSVNLTAWSNVAFATPPFNVPYQRISFVFAKPDNPTFGSNHRRELGFLQATLYYPIQQGLLDIMTRAELFRSTFPRGSSFSKDGIVVNIPETPAIIELPPLSDNVVSVVKIPFWSDIFS